MELKEMRENIEFVKWYREKESTSERSIGTLRERERVAEAFEQCCKKGGIIEGGKRNYGKWARP